VQKQKKKRRGGKGIKRGDQEKKITKSTNSIQKRPSGGVVHGVDEDRTGGKKKNTPSTHAVVKVLVGVITCPKEQQFTAGKTYKGN